MYETLDPPLISHGAELGDTAKEKKHPKQSVASRMGYYVERRYNRLLFGEATRQPNHPDKNTNQ
jgi:hypothetical protein